MRSPSCCSHTAHGIWECTSDVTAENFYTAAMYKAFAVTPHSTLHMSYNLNSYSIPLNSPYSSPLNNSLNSPLLRSLDNGLHDSSSWHDGIGTMRDASEPFMQKKPLGGKRGVSASFGGH